MSLCAADRLLVVVGLDTVGRPGGGKICAELAMPYESGDHDSPGANRHTMRSITYANARAVP